MSSYSRPVSIVIPAKAGIQLKRESRQGRQVDPRFRGDDMVHVSKKIIFIVGPTGVGKSVVAVELAKKLNGEIISCDAMQVYREVNIASDKPSAEILNQVAHHLLNVASVADNFDVAQFRMLALEAIKNIHAREKLPIIVGGSGMYMTVLLDGIFESTFKNSAMRQQLEEQAKDRGLADLYDELKRVDPAVALKVSPNDQRRVIRALEVYRLEKKPISDLHKSRQGLWGQYPIFIFALDRPRAELYRRVEERIDQMFARGLIEEVRAIHALPLRLSKTAQVLIGIPEVGGHLKGEYDLVRTKYLMKLKTRHYVKRQLTWFRRDERMNWLVIAAHETNEHVVQRILENIKK